MVAECSWVWLGVDEGSWLWMSVAAVAHVQKLPSIVGLPVKGS